MGKTLNCCLALTALAIALPSQGLTPLGTVMVSARAAKAVKKQEEKAAEAKEKQAELAKLRAKYPKEMAAFDELQAKDVGAAQRRLIVLAWKYEDETGEQLPAIDMPAKSETPEKPVGPLRGEIQKLRQEIKPPEPRAPSDTTAVERPAATDVRYPGKRVFNRLERRFEQVEGLFESDSPRK